MEKKKLNAKTRSELAQEYGVCRRTFYALLKKRSIQLPKGLITPLEQEMIYTKLGRPFAPLSKKDESES